MLLLQLLLLQPGCTGASGSPNGKARLLMVNNGRGRWGGVPQGALHITPRKASKGVAEVGWRVLPETAPHPAPSTTAATATAAAATARAKP